MYINSVRIKNIRSIKGFEMKFEKPAGWHVLIGDNGTGKSTIIQSIALALVGPQEAFGLRSDWKDWLSNNEEQGRISLEITNDAMDVRKGKDILQKDEWIETNLFFQRADQKVLFMWPKHHTADAGDYYKGTGSEGFSAAYGPFRRFAGGNPEWNKVYDTLPKLGAHLSAFGEDVALTEATEWLVKLNYQVLEKKEDQRLINNLKSLINSPDFLPHNTKLHAISSEGVIFKDGNGVEISVNQLSDGYRSILSLTFELLRQLVKVYGHDLVFQSISKGVMEIDLPGVVLVDEIDAHLHPSWQTRIGNWFTKYFPKIQFIVTTHSPLVCRASENGSIWRLAFPGDDSESYEITGIDKEKLIFGNVLDAYGTEFFGKAPVRSEKSDEKLDRLGQLNILSALGKISQEEEKERLHLQKILSTDDPFGSPTVK